MGTASKLEVAAQEINSLEPATVARALQELQGQGEPSNTQQAVQLRNNDAVPSLVILLEPSYDVTLRSHALHIIARMCRHDRMSQDSFINHGAVRKLIKNADTSQGGDVDAPAAIRALACLVSGGEAAGPSQQAAVEDVFLSGLVARMRGELSARRAKPNDPLLAAIADFLAAAASSPANHLRIRDAALLPLLPGLIEAAKAAPAGGGDAGGGSGGGGGTFLDVVYHLSMSDAVTPSLRTEAFFDALTGAVSAAPAMSYARRTALLALCNVFGPDADNIRAEEVLRVNGVPPLLTMLLAAALGPADVGAAARATGAAPAPFAAAGGGLQRRSGGLAAVTPRSMRVSDGGALSRAGGGGVVGGRVSNNGGIGGGGFDAASSAAAAAAPVGNQRHSEAAASAGWQVRTMPEDGAAATAAGRKASGNGFALSSLTAPGFGGGGGGAHRTPKASGDVVDAEAPPVPLEAVLHSLKCMAANPMLARKLAKPGSPAYALPSLLDAIVSSLQHAAAGAISRATCTARGGAGAQTLLRLATCAELAPALRAAGAAAVLRMLALEAEDPRVGEAACSALLYMGDTGLVGYTSRPAAAAFRALYRNGAALAGSEPELGNRFQVFVSHHRADAHQFALFTLYPLLVLQGVPAFVDPQHRTASSDWAHMIACCRNMVVVLSEMLLASPEHVREAEAAVAAGVNVVAVVPEGARWPDSQGNKTFDSPPPAVLLALPACLRGLFAENTLPYSASRHGEFTQQLMARLQLPAPPASTAAPAAVDGPAETSSPSASPGREVGRLRGGGGGCADGGGGGGLVGGVSLHRRGSANGFDSSRGRGRWTGRGDTQGGDEPPHRVSFTGVGDAFQRLQRQQEEEERAEAAAADTATAANAGGGGGGGGASSLGPLPGQSQPPLPWPWSRLLDGAAITIGSDDEEDQPVRYPRTLYGGGYGTGTGTGSLGASLGGGGGEPTSGSALRDSATGMAPTHMAAPPTAGAPASYTSRRFTARQRSSINRHAALQLQQQQQQWMVQQQWVQEFQQQQQQQRASSLQQQGTLGLLGSLGSVGLATGTVDDCGAAAGYGSVRLGGGGGFSDAAGLPPMLSQLLALQLEMVRYELRQAVQASHDNITYKIDRLRSDVTEQVVQLRFDLAGKIEAIHEAIAKTATAGGGGGASPHEAVDAAGGATAGAGGSSSRDQGASPAPSQQQQQQQLAAALSTSLAASLQEAVNRAVTQLQMTVAATTTMGAGVGVKQPPPPPPLPAATVGNGVPSVAVAGPPSLPKGHQGAVAMLAAAAAQQQQQQYHHNPHPPTQPSHHARAAGGGHGGGGGIGQASQTPYLGQGMDMLSPVARAGAAAWSGDGAVPSAAATLVHGGGSKSRSSHAAVANGPTANGTAAGGGRGGGGGGSGGGGGGGAAAAAMQPTRPGPLAVYDAAVVEEEAAGVYGIGGGGGMDGRLMSPTALLASVTSPATAQAALLLAGRTRAGGGGGGGSGGSSQKDRNGANGAAGGKGTLPPLAGLLTSYAPSAAAKLTERREEQPPMRKAQQQQQQQLLTQHH